MARRGPNTQHGKAGSSRNAVTHGISSDSPLVPGESPPEWQRHLAGIRDSLQPANYLMEELARLIALGLWRRRRIDRYEVETVTAHMAAAKEDLQTLQAYKEGTLSKGILPELPPKRIEAAQRRRLLPPEPELERINRYKASEHRQFLQNMHEYEALQARAKGERTPLARLDISGPPGS